MIYIATHVETASNNLLNAVRTVSSKVKYCLGRIQKSMEASAYSRILSEHGDKLTQEQRDQIRQNLVDLMKK